MIDMPFFTVTVSYVPEYIGEYKVTKMTTNWGTGPTARDALKDFRDYAVKEGYHGIIDLKFSNYTRIGGGTGGQVMAPMAISSAVSYFAYGTMVMFG